MDKVNFRSTVTVRYNDDEGLAWVVAVPVGTPEEDYDQGIILGPPDLTPLGLLTADKVRLHNELVELGLYEAPALMGNRVPLAQLLQRLGLPKTLLRELISLFQQDYYGA